MQTKKLLLYFLSFLVLYGCSTSNDSNGNSTTTVVPAPPTSLIGTVISTTQINLSWTDNSTNETGFKIERKTGTGTYALVGTVNADILTYNDLGLTPNTTYTYRMYSYNAAGNSTTYSNEVTLTTLSITNLPTLTTTTISSITTISSVTGGNISNDGGTIVTARGVVWSTSSNPTISLSTKTTDGTGVGNFTSVIVGLSANTTYYIRAYATNSLGTAYGNEMSFTTSTSITDIDGNIYQLVTICNQTWTKSNLNVSHYRNGDIIPQVTDPTAWASLTTGAWCYYNNDQVNGAVYGKLYNWYAANDPRGLAPSGYHIPSDTERLSLITCLGNTVANGSMKEVGTLHWTGPNADATNNSGFTGLPGGLRFDSNGSFDYNGGRGYWWCSDSFDASSVYCFSLFSSYTLINGSTSNNRKFGFSVRCLKD